MRTALAGATALYLAWLAWSWWRARRARATDEEIRGMYGLPDPDARARVDALQRRLAARGLGSCKRFGHALIDGRCQRPHCTYTTQRSER